MKLPSSPRNHWTAFTILAFFLGVSCLHAANHPITSRVMITEVTFSQGTELKNDDGSAMGSPHWVDQMSNSDPSDSFPDGQPDKATGVAKPNDVKSYAYSYVSNKKPMVKAVFKWKTPPAAANRPYKAKGKVVSTSNSGFTLPEQTLTDDTVYAAIVSPENIVTNRKIQAYVTDNRNIARDGVSGLQPLTIEWTVTDKNGTVGTSCSTHTIYVTWDETTTTLRQETLFNLACETANGMASNTEAEKISVFDAIWKDFSDRDVKSMNSTKMKYWGDLDTLDAANKESATTAYLLKKGDGKCGAWASLICMSHRSLGLMGSKVLDIYPDAYIGIANSEGVGERLIPDGIITKCGGVPLAGTLAGQGGMPQQFYFDAHSVAIIGDYSARVDVQATQIEYSEKVYDASYGNTYQGIKKWEEASVRVYRYTYSEGIHDQPEDAAKWQTSLDTHVPN